ncbi:MAG: hypothetical protein JW974_00900 [Alphaproteobacteria bacterium]|nr:hypothetical protein [Alphaproteobacteria bacterium]MBN2674855.1 hypothetical protein [Alphaproteobacteria bacterium]
MLKKILMLTIGLFLITGCNEDKTDIPQGPQEVTKSTIYYFLGNIRCVSCHKIQEYTTEVFNDNFKDKLDFKIVNIDKPENKHFITDYNLYTKSVILVKVAQDKVTEYKNLDKIWTYIENENKFKTYIKYEIDSFLLDTDK